MDHGKHEVETMAESFHFCPDKRTFFIEKRRILVSIYIIVKPDNKYQHYRSNKRYKKVLFEGL